MSTLEIVGMMFGLLGFTIGIGAWHKIETLETELKRRQLIDEKFDSDR